MRLRDQLAGALLGTVALLVLAGCPNSQAPPEPGEACAIAGNTATARDGQLLVCRNGRWERA